MTTTFSTFTRPDGTEAETVGDYSFALLVRGGPRPDGARNWYVGSWFHRGRDAWNERRVLLAKGCDPDGIRIVSTVKVER